MTTPHYQDDAITVHHGDCLHILPMLPDNSVDAIITDPPYGIGFLGKPWDQPGEYGSQRAGDKRLDTFDRVGHDHKLGSARGGAMVAGTYDLSPSAMLNYQSWCQQWATECLRVLKPGGHIAAFGSPRTFHRLATGIEDAGFEIRDTLAWLYGGSGFPKSLDVSKAIDRAAGAEREVVGMGEDFRAKFAAERQRGISNAHRFNEQHDPGRGGYVNPDQVGQITAPATDAARQWQGWGTALKPAHEPIILARKPLQGTVAANVLTHGTGGLNIDATRVGTSGATTRSHQAEFQNEGKPGEVHATRGYRTGHEVIKVDAGRWPPNVVLSSEAAKELDRQSGNVPGKVGFRKLSGGFPIFKYTPKAPANERPTADDVSHPTIKPLDLIRWLVKLITPPHGVVLDPFAGTGTTGEAAIHEHMRCILIEREPDYLPLIRARLHKPIQIGFDWNEAGA